MFIWENMKYCVMGGHYINKQSFIMKWFYIFFHKRSHSKTASQEEISWEISLATHDSYLTGGGGILERSTSCNLIKNQNIKEFGTFLKVFRSLENRNISLFLALLLALLKAAESSFVLLYREFSQNLKNCKQC